MMPGILKGEMNTHREPILEGYLLWHKAFIHMGASHFSVIFGKTLNIPAVKTS